MNLPAEVNDDWDRGWEEHRRRQQQRMAQLPFWEKLKWLEEAQEFGRRLISARQKQGHRSEAQAPPPAGLHDQGA